MADNSALTNARNAKKDEFYTQLIDIANELKHYREYFNNKIVLCNCDDPFESNFFKYFAMNFNFLQLKKLICTCYRQSPVAWTQLSLFENKNVVVKTEGGKDPYKIEITEVDDYNGDGAVDLTDVEYLLKNKKNCLSVLHGDGDFRSAECVELLKEADIVVTNPPFSLFREYIAQLFEHNKKFLIIGNINSITYKEIFPLIKNNKLWLGCSIHSGDREFRVPNHYPLDAASTRVDDKGNRYIRVKGVRWFTNLDNKDRHEILPLYKNYNVTEFLQYDNYNAINVDKVADIPFDYYDAMGVPITFLDKYNPKQFEILDANNYRKHNGVPIKKHGLIKDKDGSIAGQPKYARIVIRRKNNAN